MKNSHLLKASMLTASLSLLGGTIFAGQVAAQSDRGSFAQRQGRHAGGLNDQVLARAFVALR